LNAPVMGRGPVRLRDQGSSHRLNWLRTMWWIANKGLAQLVQHSPGALDSTLVALEHWSV